MTIDRPTAENEFNRFKEAMRLRLNREGMDENDRRDVNEDVEIIIGEIMAGRVSIDDDGRATLHLAEGDPLTFNKPNGRAVAVIDKKKESHKVGQQYAVIGAITNTAPSVIAGLDWADIDVCASIIGLFFVR